MQAIFAGFQKPAFPWISLPLKPDPIPALKVLTHWNSSALNFISPSSIISECFYTAFQVNEISLQKRFSCVHCFQSLKKPKLHALSDKSMFWVFFLKKELLKNPLLSFILPCSEDMECSSLLLYLENELVNTNKAEGKADTVTLMCTGAALFRGCDERAPSRSLQKVSVGGRQGWGLGHWSETM